MNRRLFQNPNFVALWLGQAVSSIGDYFSLLAIPIFVNRLTGSVMLVGLAFISTALPALLLGPVAGVFVDRLDRRKVMIVSDLLRGLLMFCLLTIQDAGQVWVLYLVGFLVSCISQFFGPARGAALPLVVPDPQDWLAANGAMRVLQTVGMLAGPALAGVTIGQWGERVAFVADGSSFLLSGLAIYFMRLPRRLPHPSPTREPQAAALDPVKASSPAEAFTAPGEAFLASARTVWAELREGLVFLRNSRAALGVGICLTMSSIGYSTVNMIWIPYLQRAFGVGAAGLGIADAALGVGMLISGLLVGWLARRASKTVLSAGGMAFGGILYATIILLPSFPWIIAWQFVSGLALTPMQSALDTILQLAVPDLKRGRVSAAINACYNASGLVGMGLASLFGDVIGLRTVFFIVGLFVLAAGVLGFWLLREQAAVEAAVPSQ
jgi:MFS transporter, DHA3 family, macrolide efflux protein